MARGGQRNEPAGLQRNARADYGRRKLRPLLPKLILFAFPPGLALAAGKSQRPFYPQSVLARILANREWIVVSAWRREISASSADGGYRRRQLERMLQCSCYDLVRFGYWRRRVPCLHYLIQHSPSGASGGHGEKFNRRKVTMKN